MIDNCFIIESCLSLENDLIKPIKESLYWAIEKAINKQTLFKTTENVLIEIEWHEKPPERSFLKIQAPQTLIIEALLENKIIQTQKQIKQINNKIRID